MFNLFKKKKPNPGPDYSNVDSLEKSKLLVDNGTFGKLLLLPVIFGGKDSANNVLYVPHFVITQKEKIDINIIKPLLESGKIKSYQAVPHYEGNSFVPIKLTIIASNPGNFKADINIWGSALI